MSGKKKQETRLRPADMNFKKVFKSYISEVLSLLKKGRRGSAERAGQKPQQDFSSQSYYRKKKGGATSALP